MSAQTRVKLESNSIPALAIALIEGMHDSEAVEGIVLLVQLLIALTSHNHVQSKLSKVFHLKLFEPHLLLEEWDNDRVILNLIN